MNRNLKNALAVVLITLLAGANAANAQTFVYDSTIGSYGTGNGQLYSPYGVTVDKNGNIYVANSVNSRIEEYNNSGGFIRTIGAPGFGNGQLYEPHGVALDSSGNLYVADTGNASINVFDPNGVSIQKYGRSYNTGGLTNPYGVALDRSGNVYVADNIGFPRIEEFDSGGNFIRNVGSNKVPVYPTGIALDGAGNVYISSSGGITVLDNNGNLIRSITHSGPGTTYGTFAAPAGVALDGNGNIYVADEDNSRVEEFTNSGVFVQAIGAQSGGSGQLSSPSGVAIDSMGNLYVTDAGNNCVIKFRLTMPALSSVSGTLIFKELVASAAPQNVTFTFRPNDGSMLVVLTLAILPIGTFTVPNLPAQAGVLHIKPDNFLATNVNVDLSNGNISGITAKLQPGDANNDNSVDSTDFGILIGAFNTSASIPGSGYDPTADFNGDGSVDSTDFGLLIGNFNTVGAN